MAGQLLKSPELVDTIEYGLGAVHQPAAHLLQVAKDCDVAVALDPGRWHTDHDHLWVSSDELPINSKTYRKKKQAGSLVRIHGLKSQMQGRPSFLGSQQSFT